MVQGRSGLAALHQSGMRSMIAGTAGRDQRATGRSGSPLRSTKRTCALCAQPSEPITRVGPIGLGLVVAGLRRDTGRYAGSSWAAGAKQTLGLPTLGVEAGGGVRKCLGISGRGVVGGGLGGGLGRSGAAAPSYLSTFLKVFFFRSSAGQQVSRAPGDGLRCSLNNTRE